MIIKKTAMANRRKGVWLLAAVAIFIFACVPVFVPVAPTLEPNTVGTVIAGTAAAAGTQTALLTPPTWTPSFTPFPSATASITPTPTEGFIFILPTFTHSKTPTSIAPPSGGGDKKFSCNVAVVTPTDRTVFAPNQTFLARWTILNTGTSRWDATAMDYVYVSGDRLHLQGGYDLGKNVRSGGSTEVTVDMRAPSSPGTYTTTWNLRNGSIYFCNMNLTIVVQ